MAPPARPGRSARFTRVRRTVTALAAFVLLVALAVAGTPGGASEDPATVPEAAAAAEPSPTPSPSAAAATEPLAAPVATEPEPKPTPKPKPRPVDPYKAVQVVAQKITAAADGFASFTLLDRLNGRRIGDPRSTQVVFSESTIKAWLAADLLATRAAAGGALTPYETARMTSMIRLSDDNAAQVIYEWLGGDDSIEDMIETCRLQDTTVYPGWWSKTEISARDLARLGDCITPGKNKFLSPSVGAPLLALMRSVDPTNAFGIEQVHPAGPGVPVAVKNGWTEHGSADGTVWNVNCLGIWGAGNRWVLAVTTRYPVTNGLDYGAGLCRRVTSAVLPLTRPAAPSN